MEAMCYVCTRQSNDESITLSLNDLCNLPVVFYGFIKDEEIHNIDKIMILKANSLIEGAIKATKDLNADLIGKTIIPMIESVWNKLMLIL